MFVSTAAPLSPSPPCRCSALLHGFSYFHSHRLSLLCCLDYSFNPSRRKLDSIGSHTRNPSPSLAVRALQLVICCRSPTDLWSLQPRQPPILQSSRMRKVRRKHRASNLTFRNPPPIHLVNLPLYPLSLKSPENPPHLSRPPRYPLLISLFPTHPPLAPRALAYHHIPRLLNQQRYIVWAPEKQHPMVLHPLVLYHLSHRLSLIL